MCSIVSWRAGGERRVCRVTGGKGEGTGVGGGQRGVEG